MADDGNRQVALTLDQVTISLALDGEQFKALLDIGIQQDMNLDGINGAINKLAENVSPPETSVAAEIASLKQEIVVGFSGVNQSIANLNNVIMDRAVDLAKWLAAIALATSTPEDNSAAVQAKIDELTANLRTSTDAVEAAINQDKSKG